MKFYILYLTLNILPIFTYPFPTSKNYNLELYYRRYNSYEKNTKTENLKFIKRDDVKIKTDNPIKPKLKCCNKNKSKVDRKNIDVKKENHLNGINNSNNSTTANTQEIQGTVKKLPDNIIIDDDTNFGSSNAVNAQNPSDNNKVSNFKKPNTANINEIALKPKPFAIEDKNDNPSLGNQNSTFKDSKDFEKNNFTQKINNNNNTANGASPYGDITQDDAEKLVNLVNEQRKKNNKSPLVLNGGLVKACLYHAKYMSKINKLTHNNPAFTSFGDRLRKTGGECSISCAENTAINDGDIKSVLESWIKSPAHYSNMLGNYRNMGIAKHDGYWTQDFN
ncbi:hypothetical protein BB561_005472 [Smittium simulii]|uniref:SCP domain-containing protein n=1 Tax=Smittium simulii TaxID=133385 RepID=A0A2T9YA65_9FUNG|nr:hypothetical protein BB561_005472 [Smittium simulii]